MLVTRDVDDRRPIQTTTIDLPQRGGHASDAYSAMTAELDKARRDHTIRHMVVSAFQLFVFDFLDIYTSFPSPFLESDLGVSQV